MYLFFISTFYLLFIACRFEPDDMDEHFEYMDYKNDGLAPLSEYDKMHLRYRHM